MEHDFFTRIRTPLVRSSSRRSGRLVSASRRILRNSWDQITSGWRIRQISVSKKRYSSPSFLESKDGCRCSKTARNCLKWENNIFVTFIHFWMDYKFSLFENGFHHWNVRNVRHTTFFYDAFQVILTFFKTSFTFASSRTDDIAFFFFLRSRHKEKFN